ncbi:MAG: CCA tRNA nucleotidyltransferase [Syntrophales bacterium]|jgi:poly(A) polymerase|nr:CCA tRNA nucleotidyltransferase [Syntrophales bacterium]
MSNHQLSLRETAAGIVRRLKTAGYEGYFVGGCVRDLLLGAEPEDFDIVTSARPEAVQSLFPKTVPVGLAFGIIQVIEGGHAFEVATYRREGRYEDGRRPSLVSFGSAEEDVQRRDFTVNGLLMDPDTGEVRDFVGGRQDIERRLIRSIGPPEKRFAEDHLRMLRAVRFTANLDFQLDPDTLSAIRAQAVAIGRISAERVRDELNRLLTRGHARRGMELLAQSGLLEEIMPEVAAMEGVMQSQQYHPEGDVWSHVLRMLDFFPYGLTEEKRRRLVWAVLLHDVGKPRVRTRDECGVHFYGHVRRSGEIAQSIMNRLRFSAADIDSVLALISQHMVFMAVRDMRPHRLKRFLRMPEFDLHLALHRLDCLGSCGTLDTYKFCEEQREALSSTELHPPRLLSGHDLQAMGFRPGPLFKEILRALETAQLEEKVKTEEEARRMVLDLWQPR